MFRILFAILLFINLFSFGQGLNHNWLVGYDAALFDTNVTSTKAILQFDNTNLSITPTSFKMPFLATQGNISDINGNLLMVSNGCWIADATLDTMQNGSNLNPSSFTSSWCSGTSGLPFWHTNFFLPYPDDSTQYVLFHQTGNNNINNAKATEVYYSIIDMNLNGGLGGVINNQKNLIAVNDTLNPGMAACRHANGRDWWIIAYRDSSSDIYSILLTPAGISSVTLQTLNVPLHYYGLGQGCFSPDGKKFAYHYRDFPNGPTPVIHQIRLFDFDRCSGLMSNGQIISYTDSTESGNGLAFSSNSQYLYFTTFLKVFQINTDTIDVQASLQQVAANDTFYSPYPPLLTDFWNMYLAANGKIYINSGNSVIDMHYIEYPDSSGLLCSVQQHAIHLPCYYARGNVYHPNYLLGCDTTSGCSCLATGLSLNQFDDHHLSISPNPASDYLNVTYLLTQNTSGILDIYNINGLKVYTQKLPAWSSKKSIDVTDLANGIYTLSITSEKSKGFKKFAVIR